MCTYEDALLDADLLLHRASISFAKYEEHGRPEDLDTTLESYRRALNSPRDHALRIEIESGLILALLALFEDQESDQVIQECVRLAECVFMRTAENDPKRTRSLRMLGKSLASWVRSKPMKSADIPDCGISYLLESVERTAAERSNEEVMCLLDYGQALMVRYASGRAKEDLMSAVPVLDRALRLTPEGHGLRPQALYCYADLRWYLFGNMKDGTDMDQICKAMSACTEAISLMPQGHRQRPLAFNRLGGFHFCRYMKEGDPDELDLALDKYRQGSDEVSDHRVLHLQLKGNYYEILFLRYIHHSQLSDLDGAIKGLRDVLQQMPSEHVFRFHYTSILARALEHAYPEFGKPNLLDDAIDFNTEAVAKGLPNSVFYCYKYLSQAYHSRFRAHGNRADLDGAIAAIEQAETSCQTESLRPQISSFLGDLLVTRFISSRQKDDIDRAIYALQHCVFQSHNRESSLSGEYRSLLGHAFLQRFIAYGITTDLESSIEEQEVATGLLPEDHIHRPLAYSRLGVALMRSFDLTSAVKDLYAAVKAYYCAVQFTRKGHSVRATYQARLGDAMLRLRKGPNITAVLSILCEAATDCSSLVTGRFDAAILWADVAHRSGQLNSALHGYQLAIDLLPQVAWLGLNREERLQRLSSQSSSLCQDAAACAVELGQYHIAVELLDRGRSIIWNTSQSLRSDFSCLRDAHPEFAQELQEVGAALETHAFQSDRSSHLDEEQNARSHRRLAGRWQELMTEIQALDGFGSFLSPLKFSELLEAASGGVVALINVSAHRSDALLVTEHEVHVVPLPDVELSELLHLAQELDMMLSLRRTAGARALDRVLLRILRRLWSVLGVTLSHGICKLFPESVTPRVWWCPTGVLSRLPLHACGPYDEELPGMADLFISSHTPTLSALLRARRLRACRCARTGPFSILAIGLDDIPAYPNLQLPSVDKEMQVVAGLKNVGDVVILQGSHATVSCVSDRMQDHGWLHFAAHAVQCRGKPLESHLVLYDGLLTLGRIAQARLPIAEFAFLSACHSARPADDLVDEALHLAGGMLFAGYTGVVASLWSIADVDGPTVAQTFYSYLTRSNRAPDAGDAAYALHQAIICLRDTKVGLSRWVPFVHLGV